MGSGYDLFFVMCMYMCGFYRVRGGGGLKSA